MTLTPELKYRLLLELSQRISRTLDLQVVLQDLLTALRAAIGYDAAGVFVLNRAVPLARRNDPNLIAGMVKVGFDGPPPDDPMLRSGKGIIGHVVRTGDTVIAPDVRLDPRYVAGRRATRSELAVPIVSETGVIGCLNLESDRAGAFSLDDAELVEFFANAAAVSIEKALLQRQVLDKQRIEHQLRVAREVQSGLLPGAPPDLPGWDIAAVALPTWAIGGDGGPGSAAAGRARPRPLRGGGLRGGDRRPGARRPPGALHRRGGGADGRGRPRVRDGEARGRRAPGGGPPGQRGPALGDRRDARLRGARGLRRRLHARRGGAAGGLTRVAAEHPGSALR